MIHTARHTAKFVKFLRMLRPYCANGPVDAETVAVGILERLWHLAINSARRGDVGQHDDEVIAEACGWLGDPEELITLLIRCGWLDENPLHRLVIHDWQDHAPAFIRRNIDKLGGFVASVSAAELADEQGGGEGGGGGLNSGGNRKKNAQQVGTYDDPEAVKSALGAIKSPLNSTECTLSPDLTVQNTPQVPTPNQTKPNLTKPNIVGRDSDESLPGFESPPPKVVHNESWFLAIWNHLPGVARSRGLNDKRLRSFRQRLRDEVGGEPWAVVFERDVGSHFPLKCFAGETNGWKPDVEWVLRPDTVQKIIEGKYDWQKNGTERTAAVGPGQVFTGEHPGDGAQPRSGFGSLG